VTSRESSEYELSGVGMSWVDRESGTLGDGVNDGEHVGKVEMGFEAERVEIETKSN
jgi:hypothetical protein